MFHGHFSKWQISKCTEWQVSNVQYFNWWIPKFTIFQMENFKCIIFQVETLNTLICPLWKYSMENAILELSNYFFNININILFECVFMVFKFIREIKEQQLFIYTSSLLGSTERGTWLSTLPCFLWVIQRHI